MPSVAAEPPPVGYVELIRTNRNFRYLWFGQIVSLLGDWFNFIAAATLTAKLTGSGVAVGGLLALRMLSVFFASPFAGVAADRFDRKTILIVSDLLRAVVVLGFLLVETKEDARSRAAARAQHAARTDRAERRVGARRGRARIADTFR